jgi:hypothetical protein
MQREGNRMFISQKSKVAQIGCQVRLHGACAESEYGRLWFRGRAQNRKRIDAKNRYIAHSLRGDPQAPVQFR